MEIGLPSVAYKEALVGAQLVLGAVAISLWLFYIYHYLGPRKLFSWRIYLLFGIIPLIAILALSTNSTLGLMWTEAGLDSQNPYLPLQPNYGIIYWACMVYVAILTLTGSCLIIWSIIRTGKSFGRQAIYLIVAAVLPLIAAYIEVSGLLSSLSIPVGITPLAACIGAIILVFNLPQFHLEQVLPVARDISFERVGDCILVLDKHNRILDLNPAAEQLTGYKISDALGLSIELIWPYRSSGTLPFNNNTGEGEELTLERDGKQQKYTVHVATTVDSSKRVTSKVVLLSDITERREAEEALKNNEEKYRTLFNSAGEGIGIVQDGIFKLVNPKLVQLLGYTEEEILSTPVTVFIHPDDMEFVMERSARRLNGEIFDNVYQFKAINKSGDTRWVEIKTVMIKWEGRPATLDYYSDVTAFRQSENALQESEEKYRSVVENAREVILISVDGIIKFANRRATELSGYTVEEFGSRHFTEYIHPDDRQMATERYLQWLKGTDVPKTHTVRIVFKQGDIRWVKLSEVLITWEGRPAILSFLTDITNIRRLEVEQQRVQKLESVGLLAGGIAHDFNNVLTAILGNIGLAGAEATPGSELRNSLEQAEKAALRAKDLTQQLLTFSKGGAPITTLTSLTQLVKDTAGFALRGSNVKCRFSIIADLWHAEIDSGQVSQVIHNLVINAQQAMPSGGFIELHGENFVLSEKQRVGSGLPLKEGNYVRVTVTDHGRGISAEHLEKIFDPFFTTKKMGSGLGLATSFSIARNHGGHLCVESELGSGSTFYLYLPASTQTAAPEPARKVASKAVVGKARILVMDDEQGVREIAGRMLTHLGYADIEFAADGAEAIKLYKAAMKSGKPFTVTILDLTIAGGMGGIETVQKLLKIDADARAIVSSGYADNSAMAEYRGYGFSGMVAKPYTLEQLRKALQDVIG
jgi:PAS domain S-box-containing protein